MCVQEAEIPLLRQASLLMVPGQRESGRLTRFGADPLTIDGVSTMDAATIADRQREGGGAPSERRPAGPSRWQMVKDLFGGKWSLRGAPPHPETTTSVRAVATTGPFPL
jgi:hypothetical protein